MRKLQKLGTVIMLGVLLLFLPNRFVLANDEATQSQFRHQWVLVDNQWHYFDDDGQRRLGWTEIDGKLRYITEKGAVINDFIELGGKQYYFDWDGESQRHKWILFGDAWYYFGNDGARCLGWTEIDGKLRYVTEKGAIINSLTTIGGRDYYFDWDGESQHHKWVLFGDAWYYFGDDGARCLGWTEIDGKLRFITDKGAAINGLISIDGQEYYFDWDGESQHYKWISIGDAWYYFGGDGARCLGWTEIDGKLRYVAEKGAIIDKLITINGQEYYFDWDGESQRHKWILLGDAWYYFGDDGARCLGWTEIDGKLRYVTQIGAAIDALIEIGGGEYYFDWDGESQRHKWVLIGDAWCYFGDDGKRCLGWTMIDGNQHFITDKGAVINDKILLDNQWYYFDENGLLVERKYQNPSRYYQIQDSIYLTGGGYNLSLDFEGLKVAWTKRKLGLGNAIGMPSAGGAKYTLSVANAVKRFQSQNGLKVTGVVDLSTWLKMGYSESDWYNLGAYVSPMLVNISSPKQDYIEAMISTAMTYLGTDYIVGAAGAPGTGIDCSGLVMQALYSAGLDLSPINPVRHSHPGYEYESQNMWNSSKFMHVAYGDRKRGDLIFYGDSYGNVIHVAIYLGDNQVIESWPNKVVVWPIQNAQRSRIVGVARPFV